MPKPFQLGILVMLLALLCSSCRSVPFKHGLIDAAEENGTFHVVSVGDYDTKTGTVAVTLKDVKTGKRYDRIYRFRDSTWVWMPPPN